MADHERLESKQEEPVTSAEQNQSPSLKTWIHDIWVRVRLHLPSTQSWMAIFSGALVVVTIISVLYFRSQLNVMEGQLNEMKESGKQTGALVKAAQDSAAAAKKVAEVAEETIRFTAESFKVSERPYIIKQSIALVKEPMAGVKLFAEVVLTNTGKTPALDVRNPRRIHIVKMPLPKALTISGSSDDPTLEIGPGIPRIMTVSTDEPLTREWVESINEGKAVVYVWGVVTYTDVMGESLRSEYCAYYKPNTGLGLWACPVGLQIVENPRNQAKPREGRPKDESAKERNS